MMDKKAFTLVEITIVMVILSALAMLIIKPLMDQLKRQQGQEAIQNLTRIKEAMEVLGAQHHYDFAYVCPLRTCEAPSDKFGAIGMSDPSHDDGNGVGNILNPASRFNYSIEGSTVGQGTYDIVATDWVSGDSITESRNSNGQITCVSSSKYQGICGSGNGGV